MLHRYASYAVAFNFVFFTACADPPASPSDSHVETTGLVAGAQQGTADVSGDWAWTREEQVRMPEFVVLMMGLTPEGPNTHARCESSGTMTVVQNGASFSGTAQRLFDSCETNGGVVFSRGFSPLFVENGVIHGNSASFDLNSPVVRPCPHAVVIVGIDGNVANELSGNGRCVLPGHPQSESPIDAPPPAGGTTVTVHWNATRI